MLIFNFLGLSPMIIFRLTLVFISESNTLTDWTSVMLYFNFVKHRYHEVKIIFFVLILELSHLYNRDVYVGYYFYYSVFDSDCYFQRCKQEASWWQGWGRDKAGIYFYFDLHHRISSLCKNWSCHTKPANLIML